ncbi:MAG: hypothetical protein JKY48_18415 [Flavobacteriales bacterium]|nr:hypothetical protein [Flavobacteriales bacterium]
MKKIFKYVPVILGLMMVMSSCTDDDETTPADAASTPSVSYTVGTTSNLASYDLTTGSTATTITINVQKTGTGKDIDVISISQSGANVTTGFVLTTSTESYDFSAGSDVTIKNDDDESFVGSGSFNITSNVGTTTYTIKATDKDGVSTSKSFDIVVADPVTAFTSTNNGTIYHIGGSLKGSWNLSADSAEASNTMATGTILSNLDMAGAAFTGQIALSDTLSFTKAAVSFDYANATVTSTEAALNASTNSVSVVNNPAIGDVYFIRNQTGIIALKVTGFDASDNTCNCGNTGKLTFEYKK